jgi:hypothetical protein
VTDLDGQYSAVNLKYELVTYQPPHEARAPPARTHASTHTHAHTTQYAVLGNEVAAVQATVVLGWALSARTCMCNVGRALAASDDLPLARLGWLLGRCR